MRRRSILATLALFFGIVLAFSPAVAKDKKPSKGKITGTVKMINKDKSTLVVMKGNVERQVVYSGDTKWMYGTQASAKASSMDDLKEGWYINCDGTFEGVKLNASACRFREAK